METNLNLISPTTTITTVVNDDDFIDDSTCSTPYVSAPSSPGRSSFLPSSGFFYSAPASPMHFVLSSPPAISSAVAPPPSADFEFEFSSRAHSPAPSADELFFNGQIRPFNLHRPPQLQDDHHEDVMFPRSRDLRLRDRSQRRRTRSLSPLRTSSPEREASGDGGGEKSAGRSSKRWVFLKDFLRSKSEGRSNNKFWHNINLNLNLSFSPAKEKPMKKKESPAKKSPAASKRRSAHELHYAANRAQAEEMRKKTFLPYRQGLLGCLGFNSRSYGAINGFARALNPVSSG